MVIRYVEIIFELISIGFVIAAAGLWAGAGVDMRPKYLDEQTLVGGTIWSQIIIPVGLMISNIVEEEMNAFVEGYFLVTGIILLFATGVVLIAHEFKNMKRRRHIEIQLPRSPMPSPLVTYDKIYYAIGFVCLGACVFKGPFYIKLTDVKNCNGPKRKNCVIFTQSLSEEKYLTCDFVVKENINPIKGKIIASVDNKNVMKIQITKPCEHLFMRPLLHKLMKLTDDCVILKGHYVFKINLEESISNYYGGSFMYGNWTYKMIFYNDDCNFTCSVFKIEIIPKRKHRD